ncbi:MAG: hypothetical protein JWN02_1719 [Acidobacteria bacterium]|nr:hypothetical protein [Acidobacteriota bacterium]
MRARFLRPAEVEVDQAIRYFDDQREGLGNRFEQDLIRAVTAITKWPLRGVRIGDRVRKFRLRTFRYNVIYLVEDPEVIIVAVAHHRRRPGYWRRRLATIS